MGHGLESFPWKLVGNLLYLGRTGRFDRSPITGIFLVPDKREKKRKRKRERKGERKKRKNRLNHCGSGFHRYFVSERRGKNGENGEKERKIDGNRLAETEDRPRGYVRGIFIALERSADTKIAAVIGQGRRIVLCRLNLDQAR